MGVEQFELQWAINDAPEHGGELNLDRQGIFAFSADMPGLDKILSLQAMGAALQEFPRGIEYLSNLTTLGLEGSEIRRIPDSIRHLQHLTELNLSGNAIGAIPAAIGHLKRLRRLVISNNRLKDVRRIAELRNLRTLRVNGNQITEFPSELGALTTLQELDLSFNRLPALPHEISNLSGLRYLDLENNLLTQLPPVLGLLTQLEDLRVGENPLNDPPRNIVRQGTRAILRYLRDRLDSSRRQWVSKLLVVGEGGAGKSSLLRSLRNESYDPNIETTHGMHVTNLELQSVEDPPVAMCLAGWDFGGQQIYHATHQFFLTNRSLFLVVWNARLGFEQGRLYYWLDIIRALAPDSPVMIVATHADERDASLPIEDLNRRNSNVIGAWSVSNKTGIGVEALRIALAKNARSLPLMGAEWPSAWMKTAEAIRKIKEHYIPAERLRETMEACKVKADSRKVLGRWLHELGDILYFDDDPELRDLVILNPEWVTRNISNVLECGEIADAGGIFRRDHMKAVWPDVDSALRDHLLRLMEKFDLSYRIPDDPENRSLVVERLGFDPPAGVEPKWQGALRRRGCKEVSMRFALDNVRPAGVPTWFIARSHRFTTNTHWRYGALFADGATENHLALVQSPPADRDITLSVRGPSPHSFFELLRDGLELTLARFEGLKVRRYVRCPNETNGVRCRHEFDYSVLKRRIERQLPKLEIECPICEEQASIPRLLFGIDASSHRDVVAHLERLEAETRKGTKAVAAEITGLRELLQREFTNQFNRDQQYDESHCPSVFALRPANRRRWPGTGKFFGADGELQLYCEAPGEWHPVEGGGKYKLAIAPEWLTAIAPHVQHLVAILKFAVPVAGAFIGYRAPNVQQVIKHDIELMNELVRGLPNVRSNIDAAQRAGDNLKTGALQLEGSSLRSLRQLLTTLDPAQQWGGLQKVLTPEGHYMWLCGTHAAKYR